MRRLEALALKKKLKMSQWTWWWGRKKCFKIRFAKRFEQDGECLCMRGGFISGKHSQEFRFGIVHPIPAFHRKLCIKSK